MAGRLTLGAGCRAHLPELSLQPIGVSQTVPGAHAQAVFGLLRQRHGYALLQPSRASVSPVSRARHSDAPEPSRQRLLHRWRPCHCDLRMGC